MPIPHKLSDDFFIKSTDMFYIQNDNEPIITNYDDNSHIYVFNLNDASNENIFYIDTTGFSDELIYINRYSNSRLYRFNLSGFSNAPPVFYDDFIVEPQFFDAPGFTDDSIDIGYLNNIMNLIDEYYTLLSLSKEETHQTRLFDSYKCLMKVNKKESLDLTHFKYTKLECTFYSDKIE